MGFAQMAGATLTVVLIASEGLTVTALYAGVLTTLVAVVSLLLFGGPMSNKE